MPRRQTLLPVNVLLATLVVAVLLGCGGDPAHPRPGTLEAKLQGEWDADPLPPTENEKDIRHTTRTIDISFWGTGDTRRDGMGTHARYTLQPVPKVSKKPEPKDTSDLMGEFNYDGLTATSDVPREDGSVWVLRLDANDPNTLYVTWKQKDGTKKLDEVKFRKRW